MKLIKKKKEKRNFKYEVHNYHEELELSDEERKDRKKNTFKILLIVILAGMILVPMLIFLYNWRVLG